jgi:16S rRNA (guanine(1405)-N(7))-methyltransferase
LHQAGGAYLERAPNYERWRTELAAAVDAATIRDLSLNWMQSHSSTCERLPILEDFYSTTFRSVGRIDSVIDIACGLNPLTIGWMGLSAGTKYYAYDMYSDMTGFLSEYLRKIGVDGAANSCNCSASPPEQKADLALILKFLPVLEQIEKGRTLDWLKRVDAGALLVSFPTRSLGGKGKGMAQNYEARFMETISGENWRVEKFVFENELCFLVKR